MRKELIKRVKAKLDAQKLYEQKKIRELIDMATLIFPNYNLDKEDSKNVVDYVFRSINPEYRTKELQNKILEGIS